jgi:hypothetical protein
MRWRISCFRRIDGRSNIAKPDFKRTRMKTQEWQLQSTELGEIFVQHLNFPRFTVQIIIASGQPEPGVSFKMKWEDPKQGDMYWHTKALDFYNNAPKPPGDS